MLPPTRAEDVEGLPAGIALLHHFANTEDRRGFVAHGRRLTGHDALATPGDLERWLREHDLLVGDAPDTKAHQGHLTRARELRTTLRAALRQDAEDAGQSGDGAVGYSFHVTLTAGHGAHLTVAADPVDTALAHIVMSALTATVNGTWHRLRMCPAPDCQWVFYDNSRPGRAKWCSPQLCGNRAKTQAYRRRRST
ncbi:CGNR zinc finger domain-containing protein [Streptomyces rhizosphaericus]|uniref:CGNR zinc finger domain-containing protein n=1 Tax=Streptomyces rhizosphaericus TaxID=114699 RepID=A0A6G4A8J3_9ACTN|nr:CGNR zinc finger domain-containing protein [Streptomyces rhizosphaericus]NEW69706.1 CGNR zinc finger domain-containing protein [Streptomyces rhizosphaericus]